MEVFYGFIIFHGFAGLPKWSPTAADVTEAKNDLFKFYASHNTIAR